MCAVIIPIILYISSLFINRKMEYGGFVTNLCITLHPLLSSLSNLIFISHYRKNFLRPFKRLCNKSSGSLSGVVHIAAIPMFVVGQNHTHSTNTTH